MKLFHRRHHHQTEAPAPGYDVQTDLALPDAQANAGHPDAFVPYGGMLSPDAQGAGYDAMRDTGINP